MNMQTGFGDSGDNMAEQYISTMMNIVTPVLEKSMVLACEYAKACGRDIVLPEDIEYASKYCAYIPGVLCIYTRKYCAYIPVSNVHILLSTL